MAENSRLTAREFQQAGGVEDWRVVAGGASAWFVTDSHAAGAALVSRLADELDLPAELPDIDLRGSGVRVRLRGSGAPGLTTADVLRARAVSAAARVLGLAADPWAVQTVQLTVDTSDRATVLPFWRTVLGYEQDGDDDLVDPLRRDPSLWFQTQDQPRPLRNRVHVDVSRTHATIVEVAAAAAALGGRQASVNDYYATLADAEGNEVDVVPMGPHDALGEGPELADWRVLFGAMVCYPVDSVGRAAELTVAVSTLADDAGLPLLVDLRPGSVTIDTGKDQWEDDGFVELARRIQGAARTLGLTADPGRLRFVQVGIDAVDIPVVREFWRVVLGYAEDARPGVTDLYDPRRLNLPVFFQPMEATDTARRAQRNRIHVDVYVPDDAAQARIDAVLAAGGRVVYDADAPEWWTLADPEGNEVDIAVVPGREEIWRAVGSHDV